MAEDTSGGGMPQVPDFLINAIKGFEGFTPRAQWDFKQSSNGYGTRAQSPNEVIDRDTAQQRLVSEITRAANSVDGMGVQDMPAGARSALISLTYNAGPGWMNSGLGDLVRQGDWGAAKDRLQAYNKAGGQTQPGLTDRRATEASWFDNPPATTGQPQAVASASPSAPPPSPSPVGPPLGGAGAPAGPLSGSSAAPSGDADMAQALAGSQGLLGNQAAQSGPEPIPFQPISFPQPPGLALARMQNQMSGTRMALAQRLMAALRAPGQQG